MTTMIQQVNEQQSIIDTLAMNNDQSQSEILRMHEQISVMNS